MNGEPVLSTEKGNTGSAIHASNTINFPGIHDFSGAGLQIDSMLPKPKDNKNWSAVESLQASGSFSKEQIQGRSEDILKQGKEGVSKAASDAASKVADQGQKAGESLADQLRNASESIPMNPNISMSAIQSHPEG